MASNSSWYKTDYEQRRAEIVIRTQTRQRLLYFSLIATGGIGVFLTNVQGVWRAPLLYFLSFFFSTIVLIYLHHDIMIAYNAQYLEKQVRLADVSIPKNCLTWERYLLQRRNPNNKEWLIHAGLAFARFLPVLLISVAFFAAGCWAWASNGLPWLHSLLSTVSIAACVAAFSSIVVSIRILLRENSVLRNLANKPAPSEAQGE